MESKMCTSCGVDKPVAEFHRFGKDGSRVGKWCEPCFIKKIADKPPAPTKKLTSKPG